MFKKLLLFVVVIVGGIAVTASMQPTDFRVTRSTTITAPPDALFAKVNDLHLWQEWSPWAKVDPAAKVSFEGPSSGVGASFSWDGNSEVGAGTMTVIDSRPNDLVRFRLDFRRPFAGTNEAEFTFVPLGGGTAITWTMSGKNAFLAKVIGLFIDCDKMIGDYFEKGFENLRAQTAGGGIA